MSDIAQLLPKWHAHAGDLFGMAALLFGAVLAGEGARRWLRLPPMHGQLLAGVVLGPVTGWLDVHTLDLWRPLLDTCLGLVLFDLGRAVDLGWLRRNPWLLATSVLEALLAFAGVYLILRQFDAAPFTAAVGGALSMSTSPAVVLTLVRQLRARGQVTQRLMMLTALNALYTVLALCLLSAWAGPGGQATAMDVMTSLLHAVAGAAIAAGCAAWALLFLCRRFGRRPGVQSALVLSGALLCVTGAGILDVSIPLAALLAGALTRVLDRERALVTVTQSDAGVLVTALLFALAGASLPLIGWQQGLAVAVAVVLVRWLCKTVAVYLLAWPSALSFRHATALSIGLTPQSGLALVLLLDWQALRMLPEDPMAATLFFAIALLMVAGPLAVEGALRLAGDAAPVEHGVAV